MFLRSRVTDAVAAGQNVDGGVEDAVALQIRIFGCGFFRRLGDQAGGGPPDLWGLFALFGVGPKSRLEVIGDIVGGALVPGCLYGVRCGRYQERRNKPGQSLDLSLVDNFWL